MVDFSRLSVNWQRWAPGLGGGNAYATIECEDCQICFRTDDYSVHLHHDENWWIVDTVNDRGQRNNGYAKLSNFDLAEKYLIWDWATTVRSDLASGPLGADLAQQGFAANVKVSEVDANYKICLGNECAILSMVNATIFSHLMNRSVDEIEQMVAARSG